MSDRMARIVSIACAAILVAGLVWGYGYLVGKGRLWPARQLNELTWFAKSFVRYGEFVPVNRRTPAPEGAARERVTLHDPAAAIGEGHYAILGWNDATDRYGVWLHDAGGELVHLWDVDETAFSDAEHNSNAPHAMAVMPDGSLIVSFDWIGVMARLDACGEPLWVREGFYHHAFSPAPDGGIWTWFGEGTAYGQFQYIVKFDPETGETLERIGLVEDIIAKAPVLFSVRPDTRFVPDDRGPDDMFHPNDVEELPAEMADAFPMFEAGDLLISIRNLDMVAVIDREGRLRWHRQGPWVMQHDPDFRPDGTISVFNNNLGRPRSDITLVDPATGSVRGLYSDWQVPFRTEFRGKHQILPNGNVLLTVPEQGQALEVAPDGTLAVEFNNVATSAEGYNEDLPNAQWLRPGFFETLPECG